MRRAARNGHSLRATALALIVAPMLLAGCQSTAEPSPITAKGIPKPPVVSDVPSQCTAARVRFALGQRATRPLLQEMRMQAGARYARLEPIKGTGPGSEPLVPDTSALTVDLDDKGRVIAARCG